MIGKLAILTMAIAVSASASAAPVATDARVAKDGSRTIVLTTEIAVPRAELWQALTTAEGWQKWASAQAWQVRTRPRMIETSYDRSARPGDPQTIRQLFLFEHPPRVLAFRTVKAPRGFRDFATYSKVVNRVRLTALGKGHTRLVFESGPFPANAAGNQLFDFFKAGNAKTLANMADVLGAGESSRFTQEKR